MLESRVRNRWRLREIKYNRHEELVIVIQMSEIRFILRCRLRVFGDYASTKANMAAILDFVGEL